MKSLLIASGCSYTDIQFHDKYEKEKVKFPVTADWPSILAKKIGVDDYVNLGKAAAGNEYICFSILDAIANNPNTKIIVAAFWGEYSRIWLQFENTPMNYKFGPPIQPTVTSLRNKIRLYKDKMGPFQKMDWTSFSSKIMNILKTRRRKIGRSGAGTRLIISKDHGEGMRAKGRLPYVGANDIGKHAKYEPIIKMNTLLNEWFYNLELFVTKNLSLIYLLQETLKRQDIQFCFAQGIPPRWLGIAPQEDYEMHLQLLENKLTDLIDDTFFIGWPCYETLGGFHYQNLPEILNNPEKYNIIEGDPHPNQNGHDYIANMFYERYEKNYIKD
jgi:hypothetical protein